MQSQIIRHDVVTIITDRCVILKHKLSHYNIMILSDQVTVIHLQSDGEKRQWRILLDVKGNASFGGWEGRLRSCMFPILSRRKRVLCVGCKHSRWDASVTLLSIEPATSCKASFNKIANDFILHILFARIVWGVRWWLENSKPLYVWPFLLKCSGVLPINRLFCLLWVTKATYTFCISTGFVLSWLNA